MRFARRKRGVRSLESELFKRLVFDAGPLILLFTNERGSNLARQAVLLHEKGEIEIPIHPNNLVEAYRVISKIRKEGPRFLGELPTHK